MSENIFFYNVYVLFGRHLEAEGLEKTFKFKQRDIAEVVDVTSARKVILLYVITWDREVVGNGGRGKIPKEKSNCTERGSEFVWLHIIK